MRVLMLCAAAVMLAACTLVSMLPEPDRMNAVPNPFPYPGIYSATTKGGTMSYQLSADGRGLSCTRAINGRMAFGDAIYDGSRLRTEDGILNVVRATHDELVVEWAGIEPVTLHRMAEAPTTCRDFFAKRR
jgi:hypothetical protein